MTRYQFLPDADLAWHVRAWGRWVLERARQDFAARYPIHRTASQL